MIKKLTTYNPETTKVHWYLFSLIQQNNYNSTRYFNTTKGYLENRLNQKDLSVVIQESGGNCAILSCSYLGRMTKSEMEQE